MEQLKCRMCGSNDLTKKDDLYVCQVCGCQYSTVSSEIVDFTNKNNTISVEKLITSLKKDWLDIPHHNKDIYNQIYASITKIGHAEKEFVGQQIVDVFKEGRGILGCGYELEIYNITGEPIKYFTVISVAYNSVGDKLGVHITKFTGPLEVGNYYEHWVDGIWQDKHIESAKIDSIMVELFDGKKKVYDFTDIEKEPTNLDIIRLTKTDKISLCNPNTPNKIYISVSDICHEEYDIEASVMALGQLKKKRVIGTGSGNFGIEIEVKYIAGKSIKSINIFLQALNSVLDTVGKIRGLNLNGPIEEGNSGVVYIELWNIEKDRNISKAKIEGVVVNFADGTAEFYRESDILSKNSEPEVNSTSTKTSNSVGCYVATCVYGSYDCPQVWTLRRYRDDTLGSTWYGRLFIRTYYAISPTLVKWFGNTNWFKKLWKGKLDRMVAKLQNNGVEDTPYEDKEW